MTVQPKPPSVGRLEEPCSKPLRGPPRGPPCVLAAFAGANTLAPAYADQLPEIVVTADRVEEPIGQTGASVTVIRAAEVEKLGTQGVADVLRGVAGLDVTKPAASARRRKSACAAPTPARRWS